MKLKKKKIWHLFWLTLSISMLLIGCSEPENPKENEPEKEDFQYADKKFVEDMSKGLQARWKLNNETEEKEGYENISPDSEEYKDIMLSFIDAELNIIENYVDEKFENNNLKELAIKYINLLNRHKEICQYMTVDYSKYEEEFGSIYDERSKIISQMVDEYNMKMSEEYQSTLNDFITNSNLIKEEEAQQEAVQLMLNAVVFEVVNDDEGWKTYQGIIENTTGQDFNNMSFSINLLDSNNIIIETEYDQIAAFTNGSKAQLEFYTDKDFASTQLFAEWWD